jgi:hypothetical protein
MRKKIFALAWLYVDCLKILFKSVYEFAYKKDSSYMDTVWISPHKAGILKIECEE